MTIFESKWHDRVLYRRNVSDFLRRAQLLYCTLYPSPCYCSHCLPSVSTIFPASAYPCKYISRVLTSSCGRFIVFSPIG